jgi:hypothetical protein
MKMQASLAVVLVAIFTIGPALWAGHYLNRWGDTAEIDDAARQLARFPTEFGPWKATRDGESLSEYVQNELGVVGYISRRYENRENGSNVNMLLMVGQPGPLLRHPPNICYANRANRQVGEMFTFKTDTTTPSCEFTAIEYEPPGAVARDRFIVAYAMTAGTDWCVPRFPRLEFGAAPKLYKVQMLSLLGSPQEQEQDKGLQMLEKFAADFTMAFSQLHNGGLPAANASNPSSATP